MMLGPIAFCLFVFSYEKEDLELDAEATVGDGKL